MERIKAITEAFSMQPVVKEVSDFRDGRQPMRDSEIKVIQLEEVYIGDNPSTSEIQMMYVGYNFIGEKKFQYVAKAVNVDFF